MDLKGRKKRTNDFVEYNCHYLKYSRTFRTNVISFGHKMEN